MFRKLQRFQEQASDDSDDCTDSSVSENSEDEQSSAPKADEQQHVSGEEVDPQIEDSFNDDDIEIAVPKNPKHSYCRLCPEVLLKSDKQVEDHSASVKHKRREEEYYRVQRAFNSRHFRLVQSDEEEDDSTPLVAEEHKATNRGKKTNNADQQQLPPKTTKKKLNAPTTTGTAASGGDGNKEDAGTKKEGKQKGSKKRIRPLPVEEIEKRKLRFQEKKVRRIARKAEAASAVQ